MSHHTTSRRRPSPAAILLVPVVVALVLALFAWPSARLEPRDLPVGVAGPPDAARVITQKLESDPGAFDVTAYAERGRRPRGDRGPRGLRRLRRRARPGRRS